LIALKIFITTSWTVLQKSLIHPQVATEGKDVGCKSILMFKWLGTLIVQFNPFILKFLLDHAFS